MATFDIITAASGAYKKSWDSRHYLLKLALVPFSLKLFCFTLAAVYAGSQEGSDNYMLFTLIMLPAFAAEGWMLSHYVRFLVLGQRWPFRASGDFEKDMGILTIRARGILGGMIVFLLIHMIIGFFGQIVTQFFAPYLPVEGAKEPPAIPAHVAMASVFFLGALFWGFRLLWVYIAYALNLDIKTYLLKLRGLATSVHMIGMWLLCFIPFLILPYVVMGILQKPVQGLLGAGAASFIGIVVSVASDVVSGIIITAGMTYGLQEIFSRKKV